MEAHGFEIDWYAEVEQTRKYVENDKEAKATLDRLVGEGCPAVGILQNLLMYCGGEPRTMQSARRELEWQRGKIARLSRHILEVANEIDSAVPILDEQDFKINFTPQTDALRTYAYCIQRIAEKGMRQRVSKRTGGRTQHLVFLHQLIARCTGRDHYKEILILTDAVARGYGYSTPHRTAEDIRKLIKRSPMLDSQGELDEIPDKRSKARGRRFESVRALPD